MSTTVDICSFGATGEPGSDSTDAILRAVNHAAVTALRTGQEVVVAIRHGTYHALGAIFLPDGVRVEVVGCRFDGSQRLTFVSRDPRRCLRVERGVAIRGQGETA